MWEGFTKVALLGPTRASGLEFSVLYRPGARSVMFTYLLLILVVLSLYTKNPLLGGVLVAVYVLYKLWGVFRHFRSGNSSGRGFFSRLLFGSKNDAAEKTLPADQLAALLAAVNPNQLEIEYPQRKPMPAGKDDPLGGLFRG